MMLKYDKFQLGQRAFPVACSLVASLLGFRACSLVGTGQLTGMRAWMETQSSVDPNKEDGTCLGLDVVTIICIIMVKQT